MAWRSLHKFPVFTQLAFALSFVAFLILIDRVKDNRAIVWTWSLVQIVLGFALVRLRLRTRHRVLRCIRCGAALP